MKQHDDIDALSSTLLDQQAWPREPLPDSAGLEARIIAKTRDLPQAVLETEGSLSAEATLLAEGSRLAEGSVISFFWKPVVSIAMAASVLMAVVLWSPFSTQELTPVNTDYLLTLEELDFQEALLLDDELLFSQL